MRRTVEEALAELRSQIGRWAQEGPRPGVHFFVYPPEWEALMLHRLPDFARECEKANCPIELVNVGQSFLAEVEGTPGLADLLAESDRLNPRQLMQDLNVLAQRAIRGALSTASDRHSIARVIVNTGALGAFASYSAVANEAAADPTAVGLEIPCVVAFPGEDDEHGLSLLHLRRDANYRVPRI